MLLTEQERRGDGPPPGSQSGMRVRLHAGSAAERLLTLPPGKSMVGSSPRCAIRIEQPGVQPLHCLIVQEAGELTARSWAPDTRLNGREFTDTSLSPGDRLTVGPVALEIVAAAGPAAEPVVEYPDQHLPSVDQPDHVPEPAEFDWNARASQREPWSESDIDDDAALAASGDDAASSPNSWRSTDASENEFEHAAFPQPDDDAVSRLMHRVDQLERQLQPALTERPAPYDAADEQAPVDGEIGEHDWSQPDSPALAHDVVEPDRALADENARLVGEIEQVTHANAQLTDEKNLLESELADVRERLAAAERHRTEHDHLAADLQQQLVDWESRLADHVRRIEELERELTAAQSASVAEPLAPEPQLASQSEPAHEHTDHQAAEESPGEFDWASVRDSGWATTGAESQPHDHAAEIESPSTKTPRTWGGSSTLSDYAPLGGAEPEPDFNDTIAHLQALSIWRQGAEPPVAEAEVPSAFPAALPEEIEEPVEPAIELPRDSDSVSRSSVVAETPVPERLAEPTAVPAEAAPQASSFIERYAHLFDDEAEATESQDAAIELSPPHDIDAPTDASMPTPAEAPAAGDSDEESIEEYMAQLMTRIRGDGSSSVAASQSAAPTSPSALTDLPAAAEPTASHDTSPPTTQPSNASPDEAAKFYAPPNMDELRRKGYLSDHQPDLGALRALANESARRAIGVHATRIHRRNAMTKVIVATLAGATSLWLMLEAPHVRDLQFITACVALVVAIYWIGQAASNLVESIRAGAYDGPEYELLDNADPLRPPLPIDVDRSRQ